MLLAFQEEKCKKSVVEDGCVKKTESKTEKMYHT